MVKFKVFKYKHYLRIMEIRDIRQGGGKVSDSEMYEFILSLVESWNYKDPETGKAIEIGTQPDMELSMDDYNELVEKFWELVEEKVFTKVPKTKDSVSPSGSTPSKVAKKPRQSRQTG